MQFKKKKKEKEKLIYLLTRIGFGRGRKGRAWYRGIGKDEEKGTVHTHTLYIRL